MKRMSDVVAVTCAWLTDWRAACALSRYVCTLYLHTFAYVSPYIDSKKNTSPLCRIG